MIFSRAAAHIAKYKWESREKSPEEQQHKHILFSPKESMEQ